MGRVSHVLEFELMGSLSVVNSQASCVSDGHTE